MRVPTYSILALLGISLSGSTAFSQASILRVDGVLPNSGFGQSVQAAGDVNGDGVPDLIVGSPADSSVSPVGGSAIVYSGADNAVLHTFNGAELSRLGSDASGIGDINGDGFADVAIGAPFDSTTDFRRGSVSVYSGADGALLYAIDGPRINGLFGTEVVRMGDLDGDGLDDLAVGARTGALGPMRGKGSVLLHSGATGALIRAIEGPYEDSQYGLTVAPAGDFDGDGLDDVLIGAPLERGLLGAVRVHSSADGSILFEIEANSVAERTGQGAIALPDFDGDGVPEVVLGRSATPTVQAYSGATGTLLWETFPTSEEGVILEPFVDRDGDGVIDFLTVPFGSAVWVRSGATGDVLEDTLRQTPLGAGERRNQLAVVGDVDLDGHVDFAVGASGQLDLPVGGVSPVGTVYVFSGAPQVQSMFCNSGFSAPTLIAQGSLDAADNSVVLSVTRIRDDAFGYFLTSLGTEVIVRPGGALNDLCINDSSGGIGRHLDSLGQPVRDRTLQFSLDLLQLPAPSGAVSVVAGETRYWQHWSRDVDVFGNPVSVFSNAIAVDFL